jgi:hypothetical protein
MENEKLERVLAKFYSDVGRNSIYYLGRCADFAWALRSFLDGGDFYLVGKQGNSNIAWHIVLKYNDTYWDVRGSNTLEQIRARNPIIAFNDDDNTVSLAGPNEIAHIEKLLNPEFVNSTIRGLKEAERKVG